jgi:hypothetical protein
LHDTPEHALLSEQMARFLARELEERLTFAQAAFLAANFRVQDTHNATFGGFNAVVWQFKTGSEQALAANPGDAGKVSVAMRGTQMPDPVTSGRPKKKPRLGGACGSKTTPKVGIRRRGGPWAWRPSWP